MRLFVKFDEFGLNRKEKEEIMNDLKKVVTSLNFVLSW